MISYSHGAFSARFIFQYLREDGSCPFEKWFENLRDTMGKAIIAARIEKMRLGHAGNEKSVGGGVYESKIYFGPGYRLYFGNEGTQRILLLCGGTKKRQSNDIRLAQLFWKDYLEHRYAKEK